METLRQMWDDYAAAVLPPDAPPVQVVESRRAFMAGAFTVLSDVRRLGKDDVPEEKGVEHLAALWEECQDFYRLMEEGKV